VVPYDRSLQIYRAFFHIACFMIVSLKVVQSLQAIELRKREIPLRFPGSTWDKPLLGMKRLAMDSQNCCAGN
jgi:hypothetical protein